MKYLKYIYVSLLAAIITLSSCMGDLDQYPSIETTSSSVYKKAENYKMVLAKLYASFVLRGQEKGGGDDFSGQDYMRCYINLQQITTDETIYSWPSDRTDNLIYLNWDSNDLWASDMYYRIYYTVALCNEFLRNSTESAISGFTTEEQDQIRSMRHDARFLRALAYTHAIDLYGTGPFVDENDPVGAYLPPQYTRRQLFDFVESELKNIEGDMPSRTEVEYGRASRGAAWALLARLYLNGEVYTGQPYYTECITWCDKVIGEGYTLESDYAKLFNADNHLRTNEIIFAFNLDAPQTMSWGATMYLICGSVSNSNDKQKPADYGAPEGWSSFRAKEKFTSKFDDPADKRALFFTDNQSQKVTAKDDTSTGYLFTKWTNLKDDGTPASTIPADGVSTDMPIFRLADVYLMYAEAIVRGGTGATRADAIARINKVRERAYGNTDGNITDGDLTLDFLLDERSKELYMECVRRTDLIRFGKFTSSTYVWEFKGKSADGSGVNAKYRVFPIPATDIAANPNLSQTDGY